VAQFVNDWEGIGAADQTALSALNSDDGGGFVRIEKGPANVPDGLVAVRCHKAAATDIAAFNSTIFNAPSMRVRAKVRLPQAESNEQLLTIRNTSNALMARVAHDSAAHIIVQNRAGAVVFTSAVMSYPCDVTLDFGVEASATVGKIRFRYYLGYSQTAAEIMPDIDNADTTAVNCGQFVLGLPASGSTIGSIYVDDVLANDTGYTFLGPYPSTVPGDLLIERT
jgi:hypothetical protein